MTSITGCHWPNNSDSATQGPSGPRIFPSIQKKNTDSKIHFLEAFFITCSLYVNACGVISSLTSSPHYDTAEGPTPHISRHYNVCLDCHVLLITGFPWQSVTILSSPFIRTQNAQSLNSSSLRGLTCEVYTSGIQPFIFCSRTPTYNFSSTL